MLNHLDLFSGIGGWTLGFHATEEIKTVGFCEIEKYPQQILKQHYPDTPIFEDVRKLDYEQLRTAGLISDTQRIDILTCSYPCQPFSVAGKKRGEEDPRHLWPEVHRLIRDDRIRPMYVLGENVGGHIRQGLDTVSEDMERCGYRWRCFSIEASCIGANHRRQRVWWIAEDVADREKYVVNTDSLRQHEHKGRSKESKRRADSTTTTTSKDVALSKSERHRGRSGQERGTGKRNIQPEEQEGSEMGGQTKRRSKSHGTSNDVANSNDNGHEGGFSEARNQDVTGQDSQSIGATDTKDSVGQGHDGGDSQQPGADGVVSRSSDDRETVSSGATGVRGLSKESNDNEGTSREDGLKEDNNRALVQEGQSRVQSSIGRGLGSNQASSKGTQVRQGTDNNQVDRVGESKDVADTSSKRLHSSRTTGEVGSKGKEKERPRDKYTVLSETSSNQRPSEDVADSNSEGLQGHRGEHGLRETGEEEQTLRGGEEQDVANTESVISNGREYKKLTEEREGQRKPRGEGSLGTGEDVSHSRGERGRSGQTDRQDAKDVGELTGSAWRRNWDVEPNVGRVANGVPNRVHRLKALGNAIVPQMAYYIGTALIKDFQNKNINKIGE